MKQDARVLVACEESQEVAIAFREIGIEAFSCDLLPCSGGYPEWHIQGDVREVLGDGWDMVIAFPPCTDLSASGARYWKEKRESGRQQKAIEFFMMFAELGCSKVAIENPIGIMSKQYRKPDQIIQPYMFNHIAQKSTCLWLKGLPLLVPTTDYKDMVKRLPKNDRNPLHTKTAKKDRARVRSKTYRGIAIAMAHQWGREES